MERSKPDNLDEIAWIRRCQRGEREAFTHLAERYQRRVFSLVFHIVRRRDEVEDLAQEILIKAFVAIRSYNFQSSFATWLSRIAINHCYDYLRHQRLSRISYYWQRPEQSNREPQAAEHNPQATGPNAERQITQRDLVEKLLARAPVNDRMILTMKELEDLSVEEIAEILELKPSTVKVRLHRARKRMLEDWKRLGQGR